MSELKCYRPVHLKRHGSINNSKAKQTDPAEQNTAKRTGFEA